MLTFLHASLLQILTLASHNSYCGLAMANGASNTTLLDSTRCALPCSDSQYTENCGGSSTLVLFQNAVLFPVPSAASSSVASSSTTASSSTAPPSTTSTSSSASASASPSVPALPAGWSYDNCRSEGTSGRGLVGYVYGSNSMTVEACIQTCDSKGFATGKSWFSHTEHSMPCSSSFPFPSL